MGPINVEHRRSNSRRSKALLRSIILLLLSAVAGTIVYIHTALVLWAKPIFSSNHHREKVNSQPYTSFIHDPTNSRRVIDVSSCQSGDSNFYYYLYTNNTEEQQQEVEPALLSSVTSSQSSFQHKHNTRTKQQSHRRLQHTMQQDTGWGGSVDPDKIEIESGYIGIHPTPFGFIHTNDYESFSKNRTKEDEEEKLFEPGNLPMDFVMATMHAFARLQTKKIHKRYVARVLTNAKKYMDSLPSLLRVSTPSTHQDPPSKITVVGDIHGDLYAMLHIFDTNGFPSLSHPYIFNGDVLDKGYRSIETLVSLLMIQLSCPQCIYITRGNHEDVTFLQSRVKKELQHLYGLDYFQLLLDVVNALPLAVLVNDAIFVVHGGIVNPNLTLDEISIHPRGMDVPASDSLITDLLWSDPSDDHLGLQANIKRWHTYGEDIVDSFLNLNNVSLLVRSHQVAMSGTRLHHHGKTITLYSAPVPNTSMKGAYMNIDASSQVTCQWFNAAPYPKISWSKYGFKK